MLPQRCALDETRTARDSRILRNERKGRERHHRTTARAPRAAGPGHFDRDRGLPHLRPHNDARDRHVASPSM